MTTVISQPRPDGPQLSIYTGTETGLPSDGGDRPSLEWTTSDLFSRHARPAMESRGARPRNLEAVAGSLSYWVRLTGDPPLGRISDEDCSRFVSSLAALPGRRGERLAANTIRKHCIEIEGLWRFAGPRTKRCRHALDLFRDDRGLMPMPWLDPPAAEENEDEARWFSVEEIRAIIDACSVATKPVDGLIPPWLWWQSLIRVAYYTGLRIGSLLSLEYGWILRSGDSLIVPASAMKKRRAHRQHLHPAAAESIDLIKTPGRVRIFQWPHTSRSLYRHLDRILAAAGLGADRHPPKFHGLRRTHGDSLGDLDAVEQSLGHRTRAQAAQYTRRRSKAAAAIDRLPDVGGHSRLPGQRLLF